MPRQTNDNKIETSKTKKTSKSVSKLETKSTKKVSANKKNEKTTKAKKATTKEVTTSRKSTATKKKSTSSTSKKVSPKKAAPLLEYYDLPYRYNETIVKILAQTPTMLFIYWDISDEDRKSFLEKYGNNFFSKTKPFLHVYNETKNYSFEVEINDFANSWYLKINDANCKYSISLYRKFYTAPNSNIPPLYIAESNKLDTPNNHILFEKFNPNLTYKNVKTHSLSTKNFGSLTLIKNIHDTHDLYKSLYTDNFEEFIDSATLNPSSFSNL